MATVSMSPMRIVNQVNPVIVSPYAIDRRANFDRQLTPDEDFSLAL